MIRDYLGKFLTVGALAGVLGVAAVAPASAQDAAMGVSEETTYVFNTLLFLMAGFLVMWMAAGFCMLESGLVRSKNVTMQSLKNMALYSIACLLYLFIGYGFMYPGSWIAEGYLGMTSITSLPGHEAEDITYASVGSDFFFQLVFCAATASIVSGTVAERIKLWPFLIFTVVLTGLIYPIQGSWTWGGGWLSEMGFSDFAGSTIVHSVGGWAALTGAVILGARKGKYGPDGKVHPMPGSNLTLATLGTFILWLGWFGFNGGSQLAMGSLGDVSDVSRIFANTNTAAAAGALAALILTAILYKKPDLTMVLNGALAGLVAITAEPLAPSLMWSVVVGGIGGVIVVFTVPLLDKLKIDDVVGAIPVHLFAGIWGTLAVVFSNGDANIATQIIGIVAIGAFVVVTSGVFWLILKAVMGLRPTEEEEELGLDQAELGMEAYPEFGRGSQSL
ncbi:MAG: ammonium transporter [Limibacillus sp.]